MSYPASSRNQGQTAYPAPAQRVICIVGKSMKLERNLEVCKNNIFTK